MASIHDICDYIIVKLDEAGDNPSVLKIQKLLYYVQAWNLAIKKEPMFDGRFQAWVHGPVNREIYSRFVDSKFMYSTITAEDSKNGADNLADEEKLSVDDVLEIYAQYSGSQLEDMTHKEEPWITARGDLSPSARCENDIDEDLMLKYYGSRLAS